MHKLALSLILLAACAKQESKLDKVTADGMSKQPGLAAIPSGSTDDRLARVERRLEQVVTVLEGALPPQEPSATTTYAVPVNEHDPVEGPADAKVTIIEAFEYLCPFCYMVNPELDKVRTAFPKDVRIVGKYMVIHGQPAIPPAMIGCAAAKQGKYTEVKNALWNAIFKAGENGQPAIEKDQLDIQNLKNVAITAGADAAKLEAELAGCQQWLQQSQTSLRPFGVNATPSFFVNGRPVPPNGLEAAVKEALARADKAIADGTPQAEYYQREVIAKGEPKVKGRFEE